jgi:hypothetical protein
MNKLNKTIVLAASLLVLTVLNTANADYVKVLASDFHNSGGNRWSVSVTLKHGDAGWEHYADGCEAGRP